MYCGGAQLPFGFSNTKTDQTVNSHLFNDPDKKWTMPFVKGGSFGGQGWHAEKRRCLTNGGLCSSINTMWFYASCFVQVLQRGNVYCVCCQVFWVCGAGGGSHNKPNYKPVIFSAWLGSMSGLKSQKQTEGESKGKSLAVSSAGHMNSPPKTHQLVYRLWVQFEGDLLFGLTSVLELESCFLQNCKWH